MNRSGYQGHGKPVSHRYEFSSQSASRVTGARATKPSWSGVLAGLIFLSACGNEQAENEKATQVVARVNETEITVHQLDHEMAQRSGRGESDVNAQDVLEDLINRQLFVQKAQEAKLDRTPEAILAMDRMRAQILSEMYLKAVITQSAQPAEAQVRAYYDQHPELFAARKIYQFRQLELIDGSSVEQVEGWRRAHRDAAELEATLTKENKLKQARDRTLAAEELPLDFVVSAQAMQPGQSAIMKVADSLNIMVLRGATAEPVTLVQAGPHIARFLANQRERQVVGDEITRLRQVSRIERLNTPARGREPAENGPKGEAKALAPPARETVPP